MKGAFLVISFAALAAAAAAPQDYLTTKLVTRPTTTKASTTASCTRTICVDYINTCGLGYGGCYPACPGLPIPTFTPPPCPTTTMKTTTKRSTKTTTSKKPCQTICVDAVNECGIKYGGCYCSGEPFPYPIPPCPSRTTATPYPTATSGPKKCGGLAGFQCDKGEICIDDPKSPCGIAADCLGICVVEEFCGGFAGIRCESMTDVCIDDPRDGCDPKNGGADCGGLCVPRAWTV